MSMIYKNEPHVNKRIVIEDLKNIDESKIAFYHFFNNIYDFCELNNCLHKVEISKNHICEKMSLLYEGVQVEDEFGNCFYEIREYHEIIIKDTGEYNVNLDIFKQILENNVLMEITKNEVVFTWDIGKEKSLIMERNYND